MTKKSTWKAKQQKEESKLANLLLLTLLLVPCAKTAIPAYIKTRVTINVDSSLPATVSTSYHSTCNSYHHTSSHPDEITASDFLACMVLTEGHFFIYGRRISPNPQTPDGTNKQFKVASEGTFSSFKPRQIAITSQGEAAISFEGGGNRKVWMFDVNDEISKQASDTGTATSVSFAKINPLYPNTVPRHSLVGITSVFNDKCTTTNCKEFFAVREVSRKVYLFPSLKFYQHHLGVTRRETEYDSYPFLVYKTTDYKSLDLKSFYSPTGLGGLRSGLIYKKHLLPAGTGNSVCMRFFRENELKQIDAKEFISPDTALLDQLKIEPELVEDYCFPESTTTYNGDINFKVIRDRVFILNRVELKIFVYDMDYSSGILVANKRADVGVGANTNNFWNMRDSKEMFYIKEQHEIRLKRPAIGQLLYERYIGTGVQINSFAAYSQKHIITVEKGDETKRDDMKIIWYTADTRDCSSIMSGSCLWCDGHGGLKCALCAYNYRSTLDHQCILDTACGYTGTDTSEVCNEDCKKTRTANCLKCSKDGINEAYTCEECVTGFYTNLTPSATCQPCSQNCLECDASSCSKCSDGYYPLGNSCNICESTCKKCNGGTAGDCTDCPLDRYLSASQCLSCSAMMTDCEECIVGNDCLKCKAGHSFNSGLNKCVQDNCAMNEYKDSSLACQPCSNTCSRCSGAGGSACTACNPSSTTNKYLMGNQCKADCDTANGFAAYDGGGTQGWSCHACPSNCKICTADPDPTNLICSGCMPGFGLDGVGGCIACHLDCVGCSVSGTRCMACRDSRYTPDAGDSNKCPGINTVCHLSCKKNECTENNNPTKCKQCIGPSKYLRLSTTGEEAGYCVAGGCFLTEVLVTENGVRKCVPCSVQHCSQCQEADPGKCKICSQGYYELNGVCLACHDACLSCNGGGFLDCTACKSPDFFKADLSSESVPAGLREEAAKKNNLLCSKECPSQTYYDSALKDCVGCDSNCSECFLTSKHCISCKPGMVHNPSQGTCIKELECFEQRRYVSEASGGGANPPKSCLPCSEACLTCQGTSAKCTSCLDGLSLFGDICVSVAPSGYFVGLTDSLIGTASKRISTVQKCDSRCLTCSGEATKCESCDNGADASYPLLDLENKECHSKCPDKTYQSGKYCLGCKKPCLKCSENSLNCLSCSSGYTFDEKLKTGSSKCKILCQDSEAWIRPNNCKKCLQNCLSCQDESLNCKACQKGFEVDKNDPKRCVYLLPKILTLESKSFFRKTSSIHFRFDRPIEDKDYSKLLTVSLKDEQEASEDPNGYSSELSRSQNTQELVVHLDFKKAYSNAILTLWNTSNSNIASQEGSEDPSATSSDRKYYFQEESLIYKKVNFYENKAFTAAITTAKSPGKASLGAVSIVSILAAPTFGVVAVKLFQMFDILKLLNIKWPVNFLRFLELFETSIFDLVPNFFEIQEKEIWHPHEILEENEIGCLFLNNSASALMEVTICLSIKLLVIALLTKIRKHKKKVKPDSQKVFDEEEDLPLTPKNPEESSLISRIVYKLNLVFNMAFFVEMMISMQIDILLSVFSNLREYWIYPASIFFNTAFSFIMLFFYCALVKIIAHKSIKLAVLARKGTLESYKNEGFVKTWGFLKGDYKDGVSGLASFLHELIALRDFLLCFFIVMFLEVPLLQVIPSLALFLIIFVVHIRSRVYESSCLNFITSINEGTFVVVLAIALVLEILGSVKEIPEKTN